MDLVRYGIVSKERTLESGFLAILDKPDPYSSEADYVLLTPGEIIPSNSNIALLRSGTLAEIQLEKRLYRTQDKELVEVGAKVQVELDPRHIHEFMRDLIARQDLTIERLEEKLNIETVVHKQVAEGIYELKEMFPGNIEIFSEYMESEINKSLTTYGLRLNTTVIIDNPSSETQNQIERNKLEVKQIDSRNGVLEALIDLYKRESEAAREKIKAGEEYQQEQLEQIRELEFFDNPLANKFLDMMGEGEDGQNNIIQVRSGGIAHIHIGKKNKNNNS